VVLERRLKHVFASILLILASQLVLERFALFAWLINNQPTVLFSQNKPATSSQPTVLFSQNKPAPATSQTNRLVVGVALGSKLLAFFCFKNMLAIQSNVRFSVCT
jgi:hypothetical protein